MITRFAPSPTGHLHLGHAYSALYAYKRAVEDGGRFILRIEDIDDGRCKKQFETDIYEDLAWLGIKWEEPVLCQADHMNDYKDILDSLMSQNLLYPCFCSRKEILNEIKDSSRAPHGPEGVLYPGTCKNLSTNEQRKKQDEGHPFAMRLDLDKAKALCSDTLNWHDEIKGDQIAKPEICGDVVLARKDIYASYHLCVTIDDNRQDITHVIRGEDLFYASNLHRFLQELLSLNVPVWHHHKLLTHKNGERLAKRDKAISLRQLRETDGKTKHDIMDMTGISL